MSTDYLMNTATILYFICYVPEFYANYINKNANTYNVFEKITMLLATGFGLGYSVSINNKALIINYGPLFALDCIALFMRAYYAYQNRYREVRVLLAQENQTEDYKHPSQEQVNPMYEIPIHIDSDL